MALKDNWVDKIDGVNINSAKDINQVAHAVIALEENGGQGGDGSGKNGVTFVPSVSADGVISWTNDGGLDNPDSVNIKGEKGKDGSNGKDGVSATHSWNGTTLTITSASGTSSANLKGDKGDKGDTGADGKNGTSVTVSKVTESTTDGGSNVVTFSDGKSVTIKNGSGGKDGKSAYAYAQDGGYTGTEAEFAQKLAQENTGAPDGVANPLWGKKVSLIGDSICYGSGYLGGYGKIIADRNNMTYQNLGQGGATITAETYSSTTGNAKGWICRMVANMDADADYAIVEGGLNDAWQYSDHGTITIGAITEGYNATLDDTTYYGAFESMLKQLVTKYQGKKIGYIAVPKMMSLYDSERNVPNFYHIALECCAKWGVPVCDLNTIVPPTEYLKTLGTTYTEDGSHPTYEGYLKYYCDPIEAWMKTLTTGGNNSATVARKAVEEYTKGFSDAIEALQKGKLDNTGISFKKAKLTLVDGTILEIDVLTAVDGTVIIPFINQVPISITSPTDKTIFGSDYNGDGVNDGYLKNTRLSSSGATKAQAGVTVTGYISAKGGDVVRVYGCDWATTLNAHSYICAYDATGSFIGGYATAIGSALSLTKYGTAISASYSADENRNLTMTLASLSNIAFIRVCSKGNVSENTPSFNSEDMIVTVNQEIT